MKRALLLAAATSFVVAIALDVQSRVPAYAQAAPAPVQAAAAPQGDALATHKATLQKYCVSCHNEKVKSGGLALSALDLARVVVVTV